MSIQDLEFYRDDVMWKEQRIAARKAQREAEAAEREALTKDEVITEMSERIDALLRHEKPPIVCFPDPAETFPSTFGSEIKVKHVTIEKIVRSDDDNEEWVDEDDPNDADLKILLTNSLMLLQDCNNLFINILDPIMRDRISIYMHKEIERISGEVGEFLKDVDTGDDTLTNGDKALWD